MNLALIATDTPVAEIPARAMLDLEPLGGGGFRVEYGTFAGMLDATTLLAEHEGSLVAFAVTPDTRVPVISYGTSNTLEVDAGQLAR